MEYDTAKNAQMLQTSRFAESSEYGYVAMTYI